MNNIAVSSKQILLIATTLSALMLAAPSLQSLFLTTAFAQEEDEDMPDTEAEETAATEEEEGPFDLNSFLTELNEDVQLNVASSDSEDEDTQSNIDSDSNEQTEEVEEDDLVTVEPIIQTTVQPDLNVNTNTHVVTDEDDCQDASDDVDQANVQTSDSTGRIEGEVGEGSVHVSPIVQTSEKVALNANVDTDVVVADCGDNLDASDEQAQANLQTEDQEASRDLEVDDDSTVIIPTIQNAGIFGLNIAVNNDVIRPVF